MNDKQKALHDLFCSEKDLLNRLQKIREARIRISSSIARDKLSRASASSAIMDEAYDAARFTSHYAPEFTRPVQTATKPRDTDKKYGLLNEAYSMQCSEKLLEQLRKPPVTIDWQPPELQFVDFAIFETRVFAGLVQRQRRDHHELLDITSSIHNNQQEDTMNEDKLYGVQHGKNPAKRYKLHRSGSRGLFELVGFLNSTGHLNEESGFRTLHDARLYCREHGHDLLMFSDATAFAHWLAGNTSLRTTDRGIDVDANTNLKTNEKEKTMSNFTKIESRTFINGRDVASMNDNDLLGRIADAKAELKHLTDLDITSDKVSKMKARLKSDIDGLIAILDKRPNADLDNGAGDAGGAADASGS